MKFLLTFLCFIGASYLYGQVTIDFTNPSTATFGTDAQKNENGVMVMWAGDVNGDGKIRYTNVFVPPTVIFSDALLIRSFLGDDPAAQFNGYSVYDVNMDGVVRYTNVFIPPTVIFSDALFIRSVLDNNPANQIDQTF